MSRFQAQTTAVLDAELSDLSFRLGLRENQKADLLRELAALAAWVIRQTEAGRRIEARRGPEVETLRSPALERLRRTSAAGLGERIELTTSEVERLAEVLEQGFAPTDDLRQSLARLADPQRRPPCLQWPESPA